MDNVPPVLFIVFRRPETTKEVFEAIRQARPTQLFIAADGPREAAPGEMEKCQVVREMVLKVDWPCEVKTLFREKNFGLKYGVSGAINWFFDHVEEGIILEDDCKPSQDFFGFCSKLLKEYAEDPRVMQISGTNFQSQNRSNGNSYFFSRYNHVWGWASWKRAWKKYQVEMDDLDKFFGIAKETGFWDSRKEEKYWKKIFVDTKKNIIKTWDYQWKFSMWLHNGLCVYPEENLITNLGFGEGATNTHSADQNKGLKAIGTLNEIKLNPWIHRNKLADKYTFKYLYWGSPTDRLKAKFKKLLKILSKGFK